MYISLNITIGYLVGTNIIFTQTQQVSTKLQNIFLCAVFCIFGDMMNKLVFKIDMKLLNFKSLNFAIKAILIFAFNN